MGYAAELKTQQEHNRCASDGDSAGEIDGSKTGEEWHFRVVEIEQYSKTWKGEAAKWEVYPETPLPSNGRGERSSYDRAYRR